MKPAMLLAAGLLAAPAARALPTQVGPEVEVRVVQVEARQARVELVSNRSAWVAVYGAFSDGSLRAIFPGGGHGSQWVEANEVRAFSVELPPDASLESVQAVASAAWFDPAGLWIAVAPSGVGDSRVVGESPERLA
jgi:hypothetical protein